MNTESLQERGASYRGSLFTRQYPSADAKHKIIQAQLATRICSNESSINRFVSGKTDKISTEHLISIAKTFEVSTDFLLGEVNTPD